MAAGSRRGRAALGEGFGRWFTARTGDEVLVEVGRPHSGLSSETLLLDVKGPAGEEAYVARLPPRGEQLFPDYELGRQAALQLALAKTDIPVADTVVMENDESFVDAPFLLMRRSPGRTLVTAPPYVETGWLREAEPAVQKRVLTDVLGLLARIHTLDPVAVSGVTLSGGGPTLSGSLDYWEGFLDWATQDAEGLAIYRRGLVWLRANEPVSPPTGLLWGDPQLVNLVFDDDCRPTTVLDWEMAALGPAEVDLAWFLTLHETACEQAKVDEFPGFGDRAAIVAEYEALLGRAVVDLTWFEVFAHLRAGALVLRIGELMRQAGMPTGWTASIPQPRHIERLIGAA